MKRPLIDIADILKREMVQRKYFLRRFVKYWGTVNIGGVECLKLKKYYYPNKDENFTELVTLLGSESQFKNNDFQGIESAWLWLNHSKADIGDDMTDDLLVGTLNHLTLSNIVVPVSGPVNTFKSTDDFGTVTITEKNPGYLTELLGSNPTAQDFISNFVDIWNNCIVNSDKSTDGIASTLLRYILFSTDIKFYIRNIVAGAVPITEESLNISARTKQTYLTTYSLFTVIPATTFSSSTDIVLKIVNDLKSSSTTDNIALTRNKLSYIYNNPVSDNTTSDSYDYSPVFNRLGSSTPKDELLYMSYQGDYYLKVDAILTDNYFSTDAKYSSDKKSKTSTEKRINLLTSMIDSGYSEKKVSGWKKILAIVIIIIVIYFTAGAASGYAAAAAQGMALAASATAVFVAATVITLCSLALTLTTLAVSYLDPALANEIAAVNNRASPIVKIAQIVTLVYAAYGLIAGIQSAGKQALQKSAESAAKEAAKEGATTAIKHAAEQAAAKAAAQSITDIIWEGVKAQFSSAVSMSVNNVLRGLNFISNLIQKNQMNKLSDKISDKQKQLDETTPVTEAALSRDLQEDFYRSALNPLQTDESGLLAALETPYEPSKGKYHLGNIQATTVKAFNLGKYN